ncbi:L-asparaginase [Chitinophaga terrae (ex Kim and Jung 2007)]|uniref:L-asparaginase n=1 Tax=Chitinophaga terrae (ex Kim and Jung 2007) TaxID=408074 RepID=A0A1H3XAY7_9BACT|nr:type II asparaginase [Chitinophaga terrae (ex Kim and Jung 2007)]MDQ0108944.1 L-asparaginase [Chitinophaga terrae (ex Kim and Jung 2007)]GEP89852.1 L-asparaginase 2 [Chitinophaga terrae (ex Kim and Jung 2007)]SDZ95844.1 L-asparaginase [Chitinophaga terrae (ex Kim and Jung 2007)]
MRSLCTLFVVLLLGIASSAQKPRIIILATGGTIAGEGASADRAAYTAGKVPIEALIKAVPGIDNIADLKGEQISNVGSQDMTIGIWQKLDKRINEIFANNEADGIVITHGTDTQEETAYFLALTVRYDKPVVITGSMRPSTAISADGPKNLFDAVTVAADPQSNGNGVMVVFDERVFDGRDVAKMNTTNVDAFHAPNTGPIGQVYDGKVMYYMRPLRSSTKNTPFDIRNDKELPKVGIAYMYADARPDAINTFVREGYKGIIIAGVGNGNFNKAFHDAIADAIKKGVVVVRASRIPIGRVTLYDEIDDKALGTIVSDDLNPQKARILLMLGLTQTNNKEALQNDFFKY